MCVFFFAIAVRTNKLIRMCRLQTEGTSSESVEIIPEIEEDLEDDDRSPGAGADDSCTSVSESTLTVLDLGHRSSIKDMIKSSSSMETSITEVLSPWEVGIVYGV